MENSLLTTKQSMVFNKVQSPYSIDVTIKVPKENTTKKDNGESVIKINSSIFDDNELSDLTIIDNHYENNFIVSDISNLGDDESKLTKFSFMEKMSIQKINNLIQILKSTLEKMKLMIIIKMIHSNKRNTMTNEIMDIKSMCSEKNNSENNYKIQTENIRKILLRENDNSQVNTVMRNKIIIKFIEMFLSAILILVLELQPKRMSYVFDFYSRLICIVGFCGTLILLGNYIKEKNNESDNNNLFKWDLIFCIFMFLSYIWLTFGIIFMYHFYITYPLSSLVVFGFLMQLIFFLDIKNNLICRRNNN